MDFLFATIFLISGFAILLFGGDWLVRAAVSIAVRWRVTPSVIGLTIIAAGTSAPELVTSLMALGKGSTDIAMGNVVGSNTFNILAILGVTALIKPSIVDRSATRFQLPFLLIACVALVLLASDGLISQIEGVAMLVFLIAFLSLSFFLGRTDPSAIPSPSEDDPLEVLKNPWYDLFFLVLGLVALIGGANLALKGGIQLGEFFGLSERVIGVTIISVGTGLPELATSMVASLRGRNDIAVSNVIGSNIFNTLGIVGVAALVSPLAASREILSTDSYWMLAATVILFPIILFGKRLSIGRGAGAFLTLLYAIYVGFLLQQS